MIFDFPEIYQITRRSSDIYYEDDEPYRVLFAAELGWVVIEKDLTWGKKIKKKKGLSFSSISVNDDRVLLRIPN